MLIIADVELLSALYEAAGHAEGWGRFITVLTETYAGGKGGFVLHDQAARKGVLDIGAGWSAEEVGAYQGYFSSVHPWFANVHKADLGVAFSGDMLFPRSDLKQTEFFADFLRPTKVGTGNGVVLQHDPSRVMVLTILYPERTEERDPDVVARFIVAMRCACRSASSLFTDS